MYFKIKKIEFPSKIEIYFPRNLFFHNLDGFLHLLACHITLPLALQVCPSNRWLLQVGQWACFVSEVVFALGKCSDLWSLAYSDPKSNTGQLYVSHRFLQYKSENIH